MSNAVQKQRYGMPETAVQRTMQALLNAGFDQQAAAELTSVARPALRLVPVECPPGGLPVGASHFGGMPDVPPEFEWPYFEGVPQRFLVQLDLAALPTVEGAVPFAPTTSVLPNTGWLLFFVEAGQGLWGDKHAPGGCFRVLWVQRPLGDLRRAIPPARSLAAPDFQRLDTNAMSALEFRPAIDLPSHDDDLMSGLPTVRLLQRTGFRMVERLQTAERELGSIVQHPGVYHHLHGHPNTIQSCIREECVCTGGADPCPGRGDAADWELLLELYSQWYEPGPAWAWGDGGSLYFMMHREDLVSRRFDEARMEFQFH
jgi:hypothetical protein